MSRLGFASIARMTKHGPVAPSWPCHARYTHWGRNLHQTRGGERSLSHVDVGEHRSLVLPAK
eukprot:6206737-Pleurochrysis_carterae.AAC.1